MVVWIGTNYGNLRTDVPISDNLEIWSETGDGFKGIFM